MVLVIDLGENRRPHSMLTMPLAHMRNSTFFILIHGEKFQFFQVLDWFTLVLCTSIDPYCAVSVSYVAVKESSSITSEDAIHGAVTSMAQEEIVPHQFELIY